MTKITSKTNTKPTATVVKGSTKPKPNKKNDESGVLTIIRITSFILIIFGLTAVYLYKWKTQPQYYVEKRGNQFTVGDLSSTLCQQYEVDVGRKADLFLIDGKAEISHGIREVVSLTENNYITKYQYAYYGTYLLTGSHIQVKGCRLMNTLTSAEILVIKGEDDWKAWKEGKCSHCAKKKVIIRESEQCEFAENFDLEYLVGSSDSYYIVLTQYGKKGHDSGSYVYSRLTLIKTVYDLSKVTEGCLGKSSCKFNMSYASDQEVVVRLTPSENSNSQSYAFVNTYCSLRVMFWAGIFGILPGGLILLCTACCCCCIAADKKATKEKKKMDIKKAIVNDTEHVSGPPSYESISAPLPSYDSMA